jgi:hypothetical protein
MSAVYGPHEATTEDVKAALGRLEAVIRDGGDAAAALEDAENTSFNNYFGSIRDAEPPGLEAGSCPHGPREATWAAVRAGQASMWNAIADHGPGSAEAAQASDLADATFVSWQRDGTQRAAPDHLEQVDYEQASGEPFVREVEVEAGQ